MIFRKYMQFCSLFSFLLIAFLGAAQAHGRQGNDDDPAATEMMVMMRDSVHLATYVFRPAKEQPLPTILIRTPYKKEEFSAEIRYFIDRGYNVVVQNTRGCLKSEGVDSLFMDDGWGRRQDGYDTVEWIATQPWSTDKIGTFGRGSSGFTQILLSASAPPHLTAQYIIATPYNFHAHAAYPGGAFRKSLIENLLAKQENEHMLEAIRQQANYGPFWYPLNGVRRAREVNVPITFVTGWYDAFAMGTIQAFKTIKEYSDDFSRRNLRLIIGPWTDNQEGIGKRAQGEVQFPENASFDVLADAVRWFDKWLKQISTGVIIEPPVRYYMMGAIDEGATYGNRWEIDADWPPQRKEKPARYYLKKNGELDVTADKIDTAEGFIYDPAKPVPTRGGANMFLEAGPRDQREIEGRDDVLVFSTPPLTMPVAVAGRLRFKLYAATTAADTDFTIKLTDVYPDGRSMLIADGILRARYRDSRRRARTLKPEKIYEYWIDLGHLAVVFNTGHSIRVAISSSNSPRFEASLNGGPASSPQPATNTIYYGGKRDSHLELPVVPLSR